MIFLAGAAVLSASRRQHCITMSSTEAELVALAGVLVRHGRARIIVGSEGRRRPPVDAELLEACAGARATGQLRRAARGVSTLWLAARLPMLRRAPRGASIFAVAKV